MSYRDDSDSRGNGAGAGDGTGGYGGGNVGANSGGGNGPMGSGARYKPGGFDTVNWGAVQKLAAAAHKIPSISSMLPAWTKPSFKIPSFKTLFGNVLPGTTQYPLRPSGGIFPAAGYDVLSSIMGPGLAGMYPGQSPDWRSPNADPNAAPGDENGWDAFNEGIGLHDAWKANGSMAPGAGLSGGYFGGKY